MTVDCQVSGQAAATASRAQTARARVVTYECLTIRLNMCLNIEKYFSKLKIS